MTNVARWAWQSPDEAATGRLPGHPWWNDGSDDIGMKILGRHLSAPKENFDIGWRLVMRLNNGQLVTARAK